MKRKKQRIELNPNNREKHYQILNIPHRVKISTYSKEIEVLNQSGEVEKKIILRERNHRLENKHLAFINKVSRYAATRTAITPPPHIPMVKRFFERPGRYEKIFEIDLNSAYWNIAFKRGYISREIYEQAEGRDENGKLIIPKKVRLIALGALAKKAISYTWNTKKKEYERGEVIKAERNQRDKFFDVAGLTDKYMRQASLISEAPLFYWCDAIFTASEKDVLKIQAFFESKDLKSKVICLPLLEIKEDAHKNLIARATQPEGTIKPYTFGTEAGKRLLLDRHSKYFSS